MNTAVIYHTKYGTTKSISEAIAERLEGEAMACSWRDATAATLEAADTVAIGAPVYGGKVARGILRFIEHNRDVLLEKRAAIFVSSFLRGEKAEMQIEVNFPDWLIAHAHVRSWLGGKITMDRLSRLDRLLVSRLGGGIGDIDTIDSIRIDEFCRALASPDAHGGD